MFLVLAGLCVAFIPTGHGVWLSELYGGRGLLWEIQARRNACCLLLLGSFGEWRAIVSSDCLYLRPNYELYDEDHQTLPMELK